MEQPQGNTGAVTNPEGAGNPEKPPVDEIQAKINAALEPIMKELETKKKELQGQDRTNTELRKQLQEKELEKLSKEEQAEARIKQAMEEADKIRAEALALKRQNIVVSKGLDPEFANLISGSNEDEINESLKVITSNIEKEVNKRLEEELKKRFGGQAPQGGQPPSGTTMKRDDFYRESAKRQSELIKSGVKIID